MSRLAPGWQTEGSTPLEDAVPDTLAVVPDDAAELTASVPTFERLNPEAALQACDGHASKGVNAVVFVLLPSGNDLLLCGNCARRHFGYEHTSTAPAENRQKGSSS